MRLGERFFNPSSEVEENFVFKGSENPLVMTRLYDLLHVCHFQLQLYPFDIQTCGIGFAVPYKLENRLRLIPGKLNMTVDSGLKVIGLQWLEQKTPELIQIEVKVQRVYFFHLAATYVPTTCLILISELILFIGESILIKHVFAVCMFCFADEDHFDTIVQVALTTMLVMYTLYQSVSASLPVTSYLKMIDIWLLFGLFIPFLVFVLTIVIKNLSDEEDDIEELQKLDRKKNKIDVRPFKGEVVEQKQQQLSLLKKLARKKKLLVRRLVQITVPLVTVVFIAGYWTIALLYYHEMI